MALLRTTEPVELMLPDGQRVFVDFGDDVAGYPHLEGDVVQTMLDADGDDRDICEAVAAYARASGLTARFFLGRDSVIIAIGDANASDSLAGNGRRRYGADIARPSRVSAAASIRT
jgi:hypothetical protein